MGSSEQRLEKYIRTVTLGVSVPGVTLSVLLLVAITGLQLHSVSRPQLDRVSFRLLTYALVANVVFSVAMLPVMKETNRACSFVAFLNLVSPLFSACMFCSIALNLQLVLVYSIDGNKMEKLYILGTIFLCGACTIPAWVAGELGWFNGTCWIRGFTPTEQLHWLLGTQSVPMLLIATLELVSFLRIIVFMIMRIQRLRMSQSIGSSLITSLESSLPRHPVVRFRWMIIRIALYPLLSCFLSVTTCVLDVYSVQHIELTNLTITLGATDLFIYCLRPLLYTMLACTDPVISPPAHVGLNSLPSPVVSTSSSLTALEAAAFTIADADREKIDGNSGAV
ncbi:hypothetical protein DFH06DRAFT_1334887 [Mycena polygramma]|nr:hypothetical protein DFH06DRAFT_1334887 [Mycena polygramma]